jgi:DNA-binding GntR family transcriptional regulator
MRSTPDKAASDRLADVLQERILSGDAPPGTWLRQDHLAVEFGVSKTPVREALRALQAVGLVELVRHRGAVVSGPTPSDLREAYAVRAELEGYAAQLAASLIRDDQLEQLRAAEKLFSRSIRNSTSKSDAGATKERPPWSEANDLFHDTVLEAAMNGRLAEMIETLHRSVPRNLTWAALSDRGSVLQENIEQHREILQAIADHDPVAARTAMRAHVLRAGELVTAHFERLQSQQAGS